MSFFHYLLYRFNNNNIILRLSYEMNDRVKREREIKIKKFISFFFIQQICILFLVNNYIIQ